MSSLIKIINLILWVNYFHGLFDPTCSITDQQYDTFKIEKQKIETPNQDSVKEEMVLINVVETHASYPEGPEAMLKFLYSNLKWPKGHGCYTMEGTVVVKIVIDKNGIPIHHELVRCIYEPFDEEALRVVKLIKKWIPAEQRGRPVKSIMNIPIRYRLE